MNPKKIFLPLTLLAAALLSVACQDSGATGPELVQRELSEADNSFNLVDTSAERFRYQTAPSNPHGGETGASVAPTGGGNPGLTYTTPEGWSEKAGSAMRDVNLGFGENGEGECYVARLPGMGGGLLANVNRWRQQMGADALTQAEAEALPTKPLFGQPASFISLDGAFAGMGASEGKGDYRMLGLILASDAGAVFVKMTGPQKLVKANQKNFDIFTSSLDISQ
tara:strand:- start:2392 stop:3063 length:672 start_codon:yes stop_codon:yes gene_type:complete